MRKKGAIYRIQYDLYIGEIEIDSGNIFRIYAKINTEAPSGLVMLDFQQ